MTDLKIDEEHIGFLIRDVEKSVGVLIRDLHCLKDKGADVFDRYLSFARLSPFGELFSTYLKIVKNSFILGENLENEFFHSKEWEKFGWNKSSIEKNPFFVQEDKGPEVSDESMDKFAELLKKIFDK